MSSVGSLSKLSARTLSLLLDFRLDQGLKAADLTLEELSTLTGRVESQWRGSLIAGITNEADVGKRLGCLSRCLSYSDAIRRAGD
jgi:hypothetical protein